MQAEPVLIQASSFFSGLFFLSFQKTFFPLFSPFAVLSTWTFLGTHTGLPCPQLRLEKNFAFSILNIPEELGFEQSSLPGSETEGLFGHIFRLGPLKCRYTLLRREF